MHSLAAGVMAGVAEPVLLVSGAASPHAYALRPSEARALNRADVVFWVGAELEAFLERPLAALTSDATVVSLIDSADLELLPARSGGVWAAHDHDHGHAHDNDHAHDHAHAHDHDHGHDHGAEHAADHGHDHGPIDAHVWLDVDNAQAMVAAMAETLSDVDPANAEAYAANGARLTAALAALDDELRATLAPVADRPYVVFHDAYQYFEHRYGLEGVGAITVSPERPPSAARLIEIRKAIAERGAVCVFAEPQFPPAIVATVIEDTGARAGVLDPLGADLPAGPDLYPALLTGMAESLNDCLGSDRS